LSQRVELSKEKLLESLKQGRFTDQRPTQAELKRDKYFDALRKNPPMENRIDKIAVAFGKKSTETGGILARYRRMETEAPPLVKIVYIKEDPSKLPYVFEISWLKDQGIKMPEQPVQG